MKVKENAFVFYLSGIRDNDTAVSWWLQRLYSEYDSMLFKLPYTPPYKDFSSIRNFQIQSRFHPFTDTLCRERLAVIDLSEWIDPQAQLDYLEIFSSFSTTAAPSTAFNIFSQRELPAEAKSTPSAGLPAAIWRKAASMRTVPLLCRNSWPPFCRTDIFWTMQ